jgi:hypothetical protein
MKKYNLLNAKDFDVINMKNRVGYRREVKLYFTAFKSL